MIEARIEQHQYGEQVILHNLSHSFLGNKIYGIIGPNGSGKSTLLKLLTGLEIPTKGKVLFKGKMVNEPSTSISCCWQKPYLFTGDVRYNIEYPMKIRGWSKQKVKNRTEELIGNYQLEKLIDRDVKALSGGETARVAIARAIATYPEVLILDEPSAALDPQNVIFVESLLKTLSVTTDITIIMVTHNMFQAKRIADETIYLSEGTIVESGATEKIFANPEFDETRQFVTGEFVF